MQLLYAHPLLKGLELSILPLNAVSSPGRIFFSLLVRIMKWNYQIEVNCPINDQDLIRQIAFHEAGHATAIYLCNKQKKQLPPVFF